MAFGARVTDGMDGALVDLVDIGKVKALYIIRVLVTLLVQASI